MPMPRTFDHESSSSNVSFPGIDSLTMSMKSEYISARQIIPPSLKGNFNESNTRDRPTSKFRIKSEIRGAYKIPPINVNQLSTTANISRNTLLSTSKQPFRRPLGSKNEDTSSIHGETSSSADYLFRPASLAIETTHEPKSFTALGQGNQNPVPETTTTLRALNPLTVKQSQSTPLSNGAFSARSRSDLKNKAAIARRYTNNRGSMTSKGNASLGAHHDVSESINSNFERGELSHQHESKIENPTPSQSPNFLPNLDPTRCSTKRSGMIKAYAANTNQGIVRNYNEDRVAIILNILKPLNLEFEGTWPTCSFFGVYDGHGGTECADFLRDNLHQLVIRDRNFPFNPIEALKCGFQEAERQFTEWAERQPYGLNRSGSCAIVALLIDDICYIANVGDSRAIMSSTHGKKVIALSRDHKPNDEDEAKRILELGGKVYQTQISQPIKPNLGPNSAYSKTILGPHRVFPGRLSVSRTFGDVEAKLPKYGGIPGVVSAEPEIKTFKLNKEDDFIVLACDGVFDKLTDEDVSRCVWNSTKFHTDDLHKQSGIAVEDILKESMYRKSVDNVTAVLIALSGYKNAVLPQKRSTPSIERIDKNFKDVLNTRASTEVYNDKSAPQLGVKIGASTPYQSSKKSFDLPSASGNNTDRLEERLFEGALTSKVDVSKLHISSTLKRYDTPQRGDFNRAYNDYGMNDTFKRTNLSYKKYK